MSGITFRRASKNDLPELVRLLAEDPEANGREEYRIPVPQAYVHAFDAIDRDENNVLIVAENASGIIGSLQITFISNLSFRGATRAPSSKR